MFMVKNKAGQDPRPAYAVVLDPLSGEPLLMLWNSIDGWTFSRAANYEPVEDGGIQK